MDKDIFIDAGGLPARTDKDGDGVRSKSDVAAKNEVLAKLVCHNKETTG